MSLLVKNFTRQKFNQKYLDKITEATLKSIGFTKKVEISLVIVGETRIKSLNKKYRKIDKVTDVLSFGNEENDNEKKVEFISPPDDIFYLGEIFVCYSQVIKQAKEKNHSVKKEIAVLLIHGILHLMGYNHLGNYEDSEMKVLEMKVFRILNI